MDTTNWQKFKLKDIFEIYTSSDKNYLESEDGNIPYVSSTRFNNGVSSFVQSDITPKENTITVARNGSVGSAFYHSYNYCASPDDVRIFKPKFEMNKYIAIFLCTLIENEKYRFAYGRKFGTKRMQITTIRLPIQKDNTIDWQWIEDYIKNTLVPKLPQKVKSVWNDNFDKQSVLNKKLELNIEKWKEFKISDIFEMEQGKTLSVENKDVYAGETPCINGSSVNNGILCFLSEEVQNIGFKLQKTPCLSLSRVGNSGLTFFQNQDFFIADNAFSLKLKNGISNKYVFLFLSTILDQEIPKYNYGRIVGKNKYLNIKIKLPAIKDGTPDWQFMEDYIKSLPYSKAL